jgi:hypothetical protein
LSEAYRSIPIHKSNFELTGLYWHFADSTSPTFFYDARLPFGASRSCKIFQSLTNAIVRMLARKNIVCCGYIDDFLLICDDLTHCTESLKYIVELVESPGLSVNWDKVAGPLQKLTFVGVDIDCMSRTLALPEKKLSKVRELVRSWLGKTKVTKKCVQKLVGKLNWCCRVVQGGRTFMRNLINLISKASQPHHYIRVGKAAKADLMWWDKGLRLFHGYTPFPADIPLPSTSFSTDACLRVGGWFL